MKLEVGMYVRSKINGIIGKITDIENIEASNGIEVIRAGIRYILDNNYNRGFCDTEKDSVIASHNIIDLIEDGDYVNSYPVRTINNELCNFDLNIMEWLPLKQIDIGIETIVTKEQFESMSYKV